MDSLWLDLRLAARQILRRPGFSLLAILTLAIGVGANAVAFSGVNALLFHPFNFDERLGWVLLNTAGNPHGQFSAPEARELEASARAFDAVAAEGRLPVALRTDGQVEQIFSLLVTRHYFDVLSARPELGRLLEPADADAQELAAVVSHRFWTTRLGGGPFTPRTLTIDDRAVSVVGVLPDDFQGPGGLYAPDIWLPFDRVATLDLPPRLMDRDNRWMTVIARRAAGATVAQAQAELAGFAAHLQGTSAPSADAPPRPVTARFYPMTERHPELRGIAVIVWIALAIVGTVLLIACFNVAALLLARASERQREIGIRTAIGASRARIVRQLLTEGLLLASLSGIAAIVIARWSSSLLAVFSLPAPVPQRLHMVVDARVLAFTAAAVVVAGILPALFPALRATRHDLVRAMRLDAAPASGRPSRARNAFVIAQIAGSTLFLAVALLVVRSFQFASAFNPGFDLQHSVVATLDPARYGYSPAATRALLEDVLGRLEASPAITVASAADRVPFYVGFPKAETVMAPGESCPNGSCRPTTTYTVLPGYFSALGISFTAGRDLTDVEARTGTAVVVSQAFAAARWPTPAQALGQPLRFSTGGRTATIVGVVNDIKFRGVAETAIPILYRALADDDLTTGLSLTARASGDPRAAIVAIREAVQAAAPRLPLASAQTMEERMAMPLWQYRVMAGFFTICGSLALGLAMVGLFGVTYFAVRQRTREFGIRIAIGATSGTVMRQVLGEGARLSLAGSLLGLAGALIAARIIARALVGVSPMDPASFITAALVEGVVAVAACALPARRATQTDPIVALRNE